MSRRTEPVHTKHTKDPKVTKQLTKKTKERFVGGFVRFAFVVSFVVDPVTR